MEKLICKSADGNITIFYPVEGSEKKRIEQDAENLKQKYKDTHPQFNFISWRWMPDSAFPKTKEFRDAWEDETPELKVDINLLKARDIQLERFREKRDALLKKYDQLFLKAFEQGNDVKVEEIKIKKQELRDSTEGLKNLNPQSIEELKASTPDLSGY